MPHCPLRECLSYKEVRLQIVHCCDGSWPAKWACSIKGTDSWHGTERPASQGEGFVRDKGRAGCVIHVEKRAEVCSTMQHLRTPAKITKASGKGEELVHWSADAGKHKKHTRRTNIREPYKAGVQH